MGSALFELVLTVIASWFVWRVISLTLHPSRRAEPGQPAEPQHGYGDPAGNPALLRPRPKSGAGAVAIAEPEEDEEYVSFRHR